MHSVTDTRRRSDEETKTLTTRKNLKSLMDVPGM